MDDTCVDINSVRGACSPVVSIVVPFYNPKKYFNELLDSLSRQTYKSLHIVLVDDGSDKKYNLIAQEFVKEAPGRLLITKENGGVASARQAGIDAAIGDLIIHADADDFLPDTAIQILVKKQLATNADIVVGGYVVKNGIKENYIGITQDESYLGYVEGLLLGKYHGSLCNKLIKRKLYEGVSFEVGLDYMEDKLLLAKILRKRPAKISFINEPVYYYRQHGGSATRYISVSSIKQSVVVVNKIADLYTGFIPDKTIKNMIDRQRAFEIYQFAKKGVALFAREDEGLIRNSKLPIKYRFAVLLSKFRLAFLIRWACNAFL